MDGASPAIRPKCWLPLCAFYKILENAPTLPGCSISLAGWAWTNAIPYAANWKRRYLKLSGDTLRFHHQEDTSSESRPTKDMTLTFFCVWEMDQWLLPVKGASKICATVYTNTSRVCDIVWDTDEEGREWFVKFQKICEQKFGADEQTELLGYWKKLQPYREREYNSMIAILKEQTIEEVMGTGGVSKAKVKQATLDVDLGNSKWHQIYIILGKSDIRFHKSKHKERYQRIHYHILYHNIANVIEDEDDSRVLHFYTALVRYKLLFPHDVVAREWLTSLFKHSYSLLSLTSSLSQPAKPLSQATPSEGYHLYQGKKIFKNIWLATSFPSSTKVKKKKKIKRSPFLIGRSRSADYQVCRESGASRSHCQLVVEDFVPYLVDLGQSKHGTYVNGERITCQPLAPGDIIQLCDCTLMFGITKKLKYSYVPMIIDTTPVVTTTISSCGIAALGGSSNVSTNPNLVSPSLVDSSFLLPSTVRTTGDGKKTKGVNLHM